MGCLRQPPNMTLGLLHNISFLKAGGLSIQKLYKKSMDWIKFSNSPNPVLGQPTTVLFYIFRFVSLEQKCIVTEERSLESERLKLPAGKSRLRCVCIPTLEKTCTDWITNWIDRKQGRRTLVNHRCLLTLFLA